MISGICFFTDKPINTKIEVPKEAHIGEKLEITCVSDGVPAPTFTITHNVTRKIVSNMATYTKDIVQYSDAGVYTCIAKNILGNDTDSSNLIIKGKSLSYQAKTMCNDPPPPPPLTLWTCEFNYSTYRQCMATNVNCIDKRLGIFLVN